MFVSTRLLKVANSRSLRLLSFVLTVGFTNLSPVCLCILPNFSIPIPLYNQNVLLWCLVYGFLELLVEVVDLIVIMIRYWCINLFEVILKGVALRRIDIILLETGRHPKTASTTSLCTRSPTPYSCLSSSTEINFVSVIC